MNSRCWQLPKPGSGPGLRSIGDGAGVGGTPVLNLAPKLQILQKTDILDGITNRNNHKQNRPDG